MNDADVRPLRREIKRLEYELRAAASQVPLLRLMVEATVDGIALLDGDGRVVEHNRAFGELAGAAPAGAPLGALFVPDDGGPPVVVDAAGGAGPGARIVRSADGRPVELIVSPGDAAAGVPWVAGARLLTGDALQARALHEARRRVEALTVELDAQRRFGELFERSPDALLLVGADGGLVHGNALAARLWPALVAGEAVAVHVPELAVALAATLRAGAASAAHPAWRDGDGDAAVELQASLAAVELPGGGGALVAVRDVTAERGAAAVVQAALAEATRAAQERGVLLKEIHHRVKNNLQIVSSMLSLQADRTPAAEVRESLLESVHRVRSMALVHQLLYGGDDLARVDVGQYARTLAGELAGAHDAAGELRVEAAPLEVGIDQAIPVGLLLNELVTNAYKHGRAADGSRTVEVRVERLGDDARLTVRDRGPGLPSDFAQRRRDSLGMTIVAALVRQLGGRLASSSDGGAVFEVTFRPLG